MKVGDTVWCEVDRFFDIREVVILKETLNFYTFRIPGRDKDTRRKKNRFAKSKEILLANKLEVLDFNLGTLKVTGEEIYLIYKEIYYKYPEILI